MSYSGSLARRWRPQNFEEVVGQEVIVQTLQNAIRLRRIHPAYIFSGPRGVGKTTLARIFAKALNCHESEEPTPKPCGTKCVSCIEIAESRSIDVLEFDAASNTQVEKIRERIIERINLAPARDRFRVFIIDEVHMLSTSSFNALLKTLEEPPARVVFIMATTEIYRLPATILSRCQKFYFQTIETKKIFQKLKQISELEKIQITDEALWEIARAGEGSLRDAQSALDQVVGFSLFETEESAENLTHIDSKASSKIIQPEDVQKALGRAGSVLLKRTLEAIAKHDVVRIFEIVDELIQKGYNLSSFCSDLMKLVRSILIAQQIEIAKSKQSEVLLEDSPFSYQELKDLGLGFTQTDLIRLFNSLSKIQLILRQAKESRYQLEIGLIKLAEMKRLAPIEEILNELKRIETELKKENSKETSTEKKTFEVEAFKEIIQNFSPTEAPSTKQSVKFVSESNTAKTTHKEESIFSPVPNPQANSNLSLSKIPRFRLAAEELEHFRINAIDDEFEQKLLKEDDFFKVKATLENFFRTNKNIQVTSQTSSSRDFENLDMVEANFADSDVVLPENPTKEELRAWILAQPTTKKILHYLNARLKNFGKLNSTDIKNNE